MANPIPALTADLLAFLGPGALEWSILNAGGAPVLEADATVRFENVQEYRLADYPQEGGAFETYNKVQVPFEVRLTLAVGGSLADRTDFLSELNDVCASTDLFSVQTPTKTYTSVNPERYDQALADGRVQLMLVTVYFRQIRVTASVAFSQTAAPSGADPVSGGTVQPQTLSPAPTPPPTGIG